MEQTEDLTQLFFEFLKKNKEIDQNKLKTLLSQEIYLPSSIFTTNLGCLESIIKYLKENKRIKNKELAKLLSRAPSTISLTYSNAQKKHETRFLETENEIYIPLKKVISKGSVLGNIIKYLREEKYSFREISNILKRDYTTIWLTHKNQEVKL